MFKNLTVLNKTKNILNLKNFRFLHMEQKMNINGKTINFIQIGEGKKVVFLLPGSFGTAKIHFPNQLKNLPKLLPNHKIIAWDAPGYGKSVPPEREFNTKCFQNDAECVVELLRQLSIDRVSLVGWSAGATTAIIIAGKYPNLIDKLILWGAFVDFDEKDFKIVQVFRDVNKLAQKERLVYESIYGKQRFQNMYDQCLDSICKFYTEQNGSFCTEEAKKIKAPTFLLHGKKDLFGSKNSLNFLLKHLLCYKYLEFPEGGHDIHMQYSDVFNKMAADFLLRDSIQLKEELKTPISTTFN